MKILQIATYYLPNFGGIEQVAYDFSRILIEQGNEVKVICFNHSQETVTDFYDGVEITRVGYKHKIASQALSLNYFFVLKRMIRDFSPDVIHIHLPNPLIATYLLYAKPKCKITLHWHSDIVKQKRLKQLYAPFEKALLKRADKIIATSQIYAEKSDTISKFLNKVTIIPNIVETKALDNLTDEDKKQIQGIKEKYSGKKIIFSIGVHREYKGLKYLVEAAQYLSNEYEVVIAGSGPLTDTLKQHASELNLANIHFIGRISDEEKKLYLWASDIYAFPSITKNEAFGIALAEALYCGLPAVTFTIDGSGVNWVNQNGNTGIEVFELDAKKYANALMSISKEKYGANARKWVEDNFTDKAIYNSVMSFFKM
ncbi:glycosyltransferase [Treponema ruminis]|uniref:Rhamnosyl/mannosyltransferase n=1 Tax=Treponema ruminis TaxID=744515 RepID=A0A7W8LMJ3_9SPIR|nr:glycosyltransferase [Treponema ruminis]MBB5226579.1 rhamnosyl/mannosyltransferase [Treponema ruminis]QSI02191.1 glycosyltransferase [Treponema ruminis]